MSLKQIVAASFLLVFFPIVAFAKGPTLLKASQSIDINLPAAKVWARIGQFHDLNWHPLIAKTEGKGGNAIGSARLLTLKGGPTIEEVLQKYNADKMSYSYRIKKVDVKVLPVTNYSSDLTVTALGPGKSRVQWSGAFYRGSASDNPPPKLNDAAAVKAVTGVYQLGLAQLKKSLEGGK